MNDKLLLAESLMEWTKSSTTTFIEDAKDKELQKAAEKLGIVLPSPDLAVFKTVYAELEKPNRNGVRLPKVAVEEGLKTLIGKQINWEHDGAGRICGYILDAKIEDNYITIIGTVFKSLFQNEFEKVQELFEDKKLFVSFEIWNRNEAGESVLKHLKDGTKEITNITFHGCALLLEHQPACPKARVYKILANEQIINEIEKIVEPIFQKDERLVYAELALNEESEVGNPDISEKGGHKLEEIKTEEAAYECECLVCGKIISSEQHCKDTKCPECGGEMRRKDRPGTGNGTEEKASEETKTDVKVETKEVISTVEPASTEVVVEPVAETKTEEVPVEKLEKAQPIEVPKVEEPRKLVRIIREEILQTIEIPVQDGYQTERKGYVRITREYSDGQSEVSEEAFDVTSRYTQAQLEEAVNAVKVDYEAKLVEKDKEVATIKTELEQKSQEIASLKLVKAEEVTADLKVGEVIVDDEEKTKELRDKINKRAFKSTKK
jgi:predicted RNA-binding Zn-ribbon protein involved in translation (DUF1610 family)